MQFQEVASELVGHVLLLRKSVWAPLNPVTIQVEKIEREKMKILSKVKKTEELLWADNLSIVEMVDKNRNIEFQLSLPQAAILLLFNDSNCDTRRESDIMMKMKEMSALLNEKMIQENLKLLVRKSFILGCSKRACKGRRQIYV